MSDKTPIKMLHDRVLVEVDQEAGERRSTGGIVIPATAAMGARRLAWSRVSPSARTPARSRSGDRVLFDPEDKAEVEVHGEVYVVMRERDVHAVAAERLEGGSTGLYLGPRFRPGAASTRTLGSLHGLPRQAGRPRARRSPRPSPSTSRCRAPA